MVDPQPSIPWQPMPGNAAGGARRFYRRRVRELLGSVMRRFALYQRRRANFVFNQRPPRAPAMKLTAAVSANRLTPAASQALIAAIALGTLYLARQVLLPIALAGLFSFVLTPPLTRLQKMGLGKGPSVAAVTFFSFTLLAGVSILVGSQISQLATNLPQYQFGLQEKIRSVRERATNGALLRSAATIVEGLGNDSSKPAEPHPAGPGFPPTPAPDSKPEQPPMPVVVRQPGPTHYEVASRIIRPLIEPIATLGIVVIFVVFMLLRREDLRDRLIWFAGPRDLRRTTNALSDAGVRLSRYFLVQTAINAAFGVLLGAGLWLIGIPNFFLWGSLSMLLRFLPYIGGALSAIFPLILAAAVDPGWSKLLWTAGLYAGLELFTGQVVEPILIGRTTGMSPLAVITAATFWTWLWGPIGLLLSTPLTLLLVVLGQHVERFNFLAVLFGDAPPLAPDENFYHKIISGNADEAVEQAYGLLKEQPQAAYYDEVALPGLRFLQYDLNSGLLSPESLAPIAATIDEIIEVVDDYEEAGSDGAVKNEIEEPLPAEPPSADRFRIEGLTAAPVLCIAGRSPFDQSVATMLKKLLAKHGIGMRTISMVMVSPTQLLKLEMDGVAFVCLSYLAVDRSPSHTRFLIGRLRRRLPRVKILACFWTYDRDESDDARLVKLRTESGADMIATSLSEAVAICLRGAADAPQTQQHEPLNCDERRSG